MEPGALSRSESIKANPKPGAEAAPCRAMQVGEPDADREALPFLKSRVLRAIEVGIGGAEIRPKGQ